MTPFYYLNNPAGDALQQLSPEELQQMLDPPNVRRLRATGDEDVDTPVLQATIDSMPAYSKLILTGAFVTAAPIINGSREKPPVLLEGEPTFGLRYVGPLTDDYALRIDGSWPMAVSRLSNCSIFPGWKSRGVLISGQASHWASIENMRFYQTRQTALDLIGCWTSTTNRISIGAARGYALRTAACNAAQISNVDIGGALAIRHRADAAANIGTATKELLQYAMLHGMAAALEHFGDDLVSDWPADDDAQVLYGGQPWNISTPAPTLGRGLIFIEGNGLQLNNISVQSSASVDDPLLRLHTACCIANSIRFEGNIARKCKIQIHGPKSDTHKGIGNSLYNVQALDVSEPWHACESVLRYSGSTSSNRLVGGKAENITQALVSYERPGVHHSNEESGFWLVQR